MSATIVFDYSKCVCVCFSIGKCVKQCAWHNKEQIINVLCVVMSEMGVRLAKLIKNSSSRLMKKNMSPNVTWN